MFDHENDFRHNADPNFDPQHEVKTVSTTPPILQLVIFLAVLFLLAVFACPMLADVGYEPRPGSLSLAGTGHGKPAVPIKILPRNVTWTQARLTEAFGPNWAAGAPGPHSSDYLNYLSEQFASRTARWLSGPDDVRYRDNAPLSKQDLGVPSEWEMLYAYYTRDARVIPRQTRPTDPVPSLCPSGQTCQPFPAPACPSCSSCCPACPACPACPPSVSCAPSTGTPPQGILLVIWDTRTTPPARRFATWIGDRYLLHSGAEIEAGKVSQWLVVPQ